MIEFDCENCRHKIFTSDANLVGEQIHCPLCKAAIFVPYESDEKYKANYAKFVYGLLFVATLFAIKLVVSYINNHGLK